MQTKSLNGFKIASAEESAQDSSLSFKNLIAASGSSDGTGKKTTAVIERTVRPRLSAHTVPITNVL
jgi:hypothetical protein